MGITILSGSKPFLHNNDEIKNTINNIINIKIIPTIVLILIILIKLIPSKFNIRDDTSAMNYIIGNIIIAKNIIIEKICIFFPKRKLGLINPT